MQLTFQVAKKTCCIKKLFCYLKNRISIRVTTTTRRRNHSGERRGLSPLSSVAPRHHSPDTTIQNRPRKCHFCHPQNTEAHHNSRQSREIRILKRKTRVRVFHARSLRRSTQVRITIYDNCSRITHFPIIKKPRAPHTFCHFWQTSDPITGSSPNHTESTRE
jgi:hypothetical protein